MGNVERWSLVVSIVMNQLCLARLLGQVTYRPWETRQREATPGQIRGSCLRFCCRLAHLLARAKDVENRLEELLGFIQSLYLAMMWLSKSQRSLPHRADEPI
jgi:hypothetical protein